MLLIYFVTSILLLLLLVTRLKVHPFIALLLVSLKFGFASGMEYEAIINSITEGFGGVMGKTGLIILFGVILGTFLEVSGGAFLLAERILHLIGRKFIHAAILVTGYVVSIPVFADSGFVMLSSLNKTLAQKAKVSGTGAVIALALGLMCSHTMVPPTPGPIAAAGILGADLGKVIFYSIPVTFVSLFACYFYAKFVGKKDNDIQPLEEPVDEKKKSQPLLEVVLVILLLPMLLIILKSVAVYPTHPLGTGKFYHLIAFIGDPVIALMIGAMLSMVLVGKKEGNHSGRTEIINGALKTAAPILLITGAGGIFGTVLKNSGIVDEVQDIFLIPGLKLVLPFLLASVLKTAQGSSTVAIVTTAAIVAPMASSMGLDTENLRVLTVLAIGAGAAIISHVNDSFFWVVCQMSGWSMNKGLKFYSMGSFVLGLFAMLAILAISLIIS